MAKTEKKDQNAPEIVEVKDEPLFGQKKETPPMFEFRPEDYIQILNQLRVIKRHVTVAPTATPRNFMDQIQFFDDGVDFKLYLWINGTWRSVALA